MKVLLVSFAVLCAVAYTVEAQFGFPGGPVGPGGPGVPGGFGFPRPRPQFPPGSTGPTFPRPPIMVPTRFRREPQGSIRLEGTQPLSGPDRHPTLDLNYNQRLIDNGRTTLDAYGGGRLHQNHVYPHAGLQYEHRFKNDMFVRGQGNVQPGPHGGLSPSFGAGVGWRFRREALPYEQEEEEKQQVAEEEAY